MMKFIFLGIGSFLVLFGLMAVLATIMRLGSEVAGGIGFIIIVLGLFLFVKGAKKNEILLCGYCDFETDDMDKLLRHQLVCEKYKQGTKQVPKKIETPTQETKYFQCVYCKMLFEKEVEQLNHYLICETKKKVQSHKEIDEKPKDSFKPSAKLIRDEDSSLEELERKIREDNEL